ncbi:MAG: YciI family protein [Yaniella sp.]|uniref:YciI family protein n=1 Tax=Yaniella sp. TaxID=2773929 RepID=UPI003F973EB2
MAIYTLKYQYVDDVGFVNEHRPQHREYLQHLFHQGHLLAAGPLVDDESAGGLLLFSVESKDRVTELATKDPFVIRGVVVSRHVSEWQVAFGKERFDAK